MELENMLYEVTWTQKDMHAIHKWIWAKKYRFNQVKPWYEQTARKNMAW